MEDKELQKLIDAKRWQLENQQQQEEIASRIGSRRIVWPWWVGSAAAAAILAFLLLSPALFGGKGELVAKAEKIEEIKEIVEVEENEMQEMLEPIERIEATEKVPAKAVSTTLPSVEAIAAVEPIPAVEPLSVVEPTPTPPDMDSTPSAPRVHTRRSHRLANVEKTPEMPRVPALIAHYINIPDSILFTNDIVINLK